MRFREYRLVAITACLVAALLIANRARANPTGSEPYQPLDAHGTISEAKDLVASLYEIYEEEEKFVSETYAKRDNPASFSDRQISKAAGRLWKARRNVEHLKLMGEPAAEDLDGKLQLLAAEVYKFGSAYRGTPRGVQLVQRYKQQLDREKPRFTKFLQQADRAIEQGKLEAVESQLEPRGIDLQEKLVFFIPTARQPYISVFNRVLGKNDNLLRPKRQSAYQQRGGEAMAKQIAAATELRSELERLAAEIASSGTAQLEGDKTGGPAQAIAYAGKLWGTASAGLIRAAAIQWAFTNKSTAEVKPSPEQLKDMALRSLVSIIEAAAESTPPDQLSSVYPELLKEISVIERRLGPYSTEVQTTCAPALAKLAAKDSGFAAQVKAYERATSEPLRWRKLYASQQAKNLAQNFPAAIGLLDSTAPASDGIRPEFVLARNRETTTAPKSFSESANWMVQEAAARLVGKPIAQDQMIRLAPTSRTSVVPFSGRHYGNVPAEMPGGKEVGDLRTAILVDETHGPLTIESADAISASQLHDYLSVSGLVQQVHLESVVTRFVGLPDIAYMLVPLGQLPTVDERMTPLQQTCWRLDTKPLWAHHRYFTVRAAADSQ